MPAHAGADARHHVTTHAGADTGPHVRRRRRLPPASRRGRRSGPTSIPPPDDPDYIATLVPNLAGFAEHLSTPELVAAQIDAAAGRRPPRRRRRGPVATICAAIRMDRPLAVRGRWERDGRRVASTDLERRDAAGFGECLTNDGEPLEDGSYQYIAADSNGNESAAGGIVVGAARLEQEFRNNSDVDICAVRIAPSSSRYFEVYVFNARRSPPVRRSRCRWPTSSRTSRRWVRRRELASFSFQPDAGAVQSLAR